MTTFMHYLTICTKLQISYVLNATVPSPTEPSMDADRGGRKLLLNLYLMQ